MARRSTAERRRRARAHKRPANTSGASNAAPANQSSRTNSPRAESRRPERNVSARVADAGITATGSGDVSASIAGAALPAPLDLIPHFMLPVTPSSSVAEVTAVAQQAWAWLVERLPPATRDGLADEWPGEQVDWHALGRRVRGLLAAIALGHRGGGVPVGRRYHTATMGALAAVIVIGVIGVSLASSAIAQGAHGPHGWMGLAPAAGTATPTAGVIVVHSAPELLTPTPVESRYRIGAWVSNSTPASSGTIDIFVSVRDGVSPLAKVAVTVHVVYTCAAPATAQDYGPVTTGADGIADVPVTFSNLPVGEPVCVTVTATIAHRVYSTTTTFNAA